MTIESLRYAVNLSMLFTELPLLQRPAAAKAAGFDAVEFWWPFATAVPADAEVDAFITAVTDAGVQLIGLNFFAGDMPGGDRGLVSWPARSGEFRDNIDVTVGIGERLGCRAFNALYGNRTDDSTPQAQDDVAAENLVLAGQAASPDRRGGAGRAGQRRRAVPVAHRGRRHRGDRPGGTGFGRDEPEVPVRPVPPGSQRRQRRQRDRDVRRPGRARADRRLPRPRRTGHGQAGHRRAPGCVGGEGLSRVRRAGVQADRRHPGQPGLAAARPAATSAATPVG